jgi:hypothetical protein
VLAVAPVGCDWPVLRTDFYCQSDESRYYITVGKEFATHETVSHSRGEYVRDTNTVEGYFSIFKRGMRGIMAMALSPYFGGVAFQKGGADLTLALVTAIALINVLLVGVLRLITRRKSRRIRPLTPFADC